MKYIMTSIGMSSREPMSYVFDADVETEFGTFRVRTQLNHDREEKPFSITLSIGGDQTCLNFAVPFTNENVFLSYAQSSKPGIACTLDSKVIKGDSTIKMMHFGTTLLKEMTNKTIVEFNDTGHIDCLNPDGSISKMSLPMYNFMFYGETWYESKFGAIPTYKHDRDMYAKLKCLRLDPRNKRNFEFNNASLNSVMKEIYSESESWGDFFMNISKKYKENRCSIVQPWIRNAYNEMSKGSFSIYSTHWYFSYENFPIIPYKILKVYSNGAKIIGGGGYNSKLPYDDECLDWSIHPHTIALDYTPLLRKACRKTRRNKRLHHLAF